MNSILVVCLGNICRSPMAEGLLRVKFPNGTIASAGIRAVTGFPADPSSVRVMAENGFDITEHRAKQLTDEMAEQADLILTMEKKQSEYIAAYYPGHKATIMRIGEFGNFDVPDPYMQPINEFRKTYQLLIQGIDDVMRHFFRV